MTPDWLIFKNFFGQWNPHSRISLQGTRNFLFTKISGIYFLNFIGQQQVDLRHWWTIDHLDKQMPAWLGDWASKGRLPLGEWFAWTACWSGSLCRGALLGQFVESSPADCVWAELYLCCEGEWHCVGMWWGKLWPIRARELWWFANFDTHRSSFRYFECPKHPFFHQHHLYHENCCSFCDETRIWTGVLCN